MKLQFRHQPFQTDAAKAVCDVFAGQPFRTPTYIVKRHIIIPAGDRKATNSHRQKNIADIIASQIKT